MKFQRKEPSTIVWYEGETLSCVTRNNEEATADNQTAHFLFISPTFESTSTYMVWGGSNWQASTKISVYSSSHLFISLPFLLDTKAGAKNNSPSHTHTESIQVPCLKTTLPLAHTHTEKAYKYHAFSLHKTAEWQAEVHTKTHTQNKNTSTDIEKKK